MFCSSFVFRANFPIGPHVHIVYKTHLGSFVVINILCTLYSDTATEEASLADLVVTGTKLLTAVEDILKTTQRLTSFAGEQ